MLPLTLFVRALGASLQGPAPIQWIDGFIDSTLRRAQVAGALVVIVRADSVLLAKGYGLANVQQKIPVDAARTGFRLGSVSKLLTATAVMQLVEEGQLDLDRDVSQYLDFRLRNPYPTPITLRHLLTHSAGFTNVLKGLGYLDASLAPTLEEHVKRYQPQVTYPPGTTPAYSNYGIVLAGYIVQRTSGLPFEEYIARSIFAPLGMTRSTFLQPLPAELEVDMSRGYIVASGPTQPFEVLGTMPAGAGTTTGTDFARFMMAHLNRGNVGEARILKPETVLLMHQQQALPPGPPGFGGMALGFRHGGSEGPVSIGHGGDTVAFHTGLMLFLDPGLGVFIAVNSQGSDSLDGNGLVAAFLEEFALRLAAPDSAAPAATATAAAHAAIVAGRYIPSRHFEGSFLGFLNLLADQVTANGDGTISIASMTGRSGAAKRWRETAPWIWQEVGGPDRLAVTLEGDRVTMIRRSSDASTVLLPARDARTAGWNIPLLLATLVILGLEALRLLFLVVRRVTRRVRDPEPRMTRAAHVGVLLAAVALAGWISLIYGLMQGHIGLISGTKDIPIRVLQVAGVLALLLLPAVIGSTVAAVRSRGIRALWTALVAGACLGFAWFAFAFRLLGPSLMY